ncbi:hypothetical protein BGZ65_008999 [Modicella reniformis]|uniref:Uncharacterized protein n=1 Tax=Modicella reniformis TaxID=1440133 RepID=A0A9P6JGE9_9FUNG|nr:hypothetical protein BGZ65_008999 [Modicella reniformis]
MMNGPCLPIAIEVLRFVPGQLRNNRSSTSLASRTVTIYEDDESSPLLSSGLIPTRRQVSQWTNSMWKRQLVLLVLPVTILLGIFVYYFTGLEIYRLTWVSLTFCTMAIPLLVAFLVIRSENRNVYRHSLTVAQKTFLTASSIESRIPASYIRFLWLCVALAIALSTIVTGELYAAQFIQTSPHTTIEGLIYVYSWVGTIYILDAITDYIVETRFVVIQLASSFWVCIFHPICMTRKMYDAMVYLFGITRNYDEYKRQVGRGLFLRNLAENVTMLAFLCWVNILYYGPNAKIYQYFQFNDENRTYNHDVTVYASLGIWASELVSNFINRAICKKFVNHHVTKEALKDFKEYPELIVAFILVMIHILQDMLLALLDLNFA